MTEHKVYSRFTTELKVRPDDIDMFNHVHNSKYFDYVLAARYEQMETAYGMSMEQFMEMGYGWVVKTAHVNFKRPLTLGESFKVTTGIMSMDEKSSKVSFDIVSSKTGKVCSDGWFDYVLIDLKTGRGMKITQEMIDKYSI
ncbi:thioesterase family protein [Pedobacter sp. SYSU D00535]|uniref:acyl-CoA thioesterase n=1 Tax=Pedobacter sp. SYSU D00535 TaxID=2810308 RepID=UPI001A976386|nr:acyl-CoA thioesterase [Pedobacter sp. SYSU D00535]